MDCPRKIFTHTEFDIHYVKLYKFQVSDGELPCAVMNNSLKKSFPLVFIAPMLCNALAVLSGLFTYPLILTHSEDIQIATIIEDTNFIAIFLLFTGGLIAAMIYLKPCINYIYGLKGDDTLNIARSRVLGVPIVLSFIGSFCWILYMMAVYFLGATIQNIPIESRTTTLFVLDKILTSGLSFVFSYYSLELISRKILVPNFFPDGDFSTCCNGFTATIRQRVYILHFSVAIFPMYMVYCILLGMQRKGELTANLVPVTITICGLIVVGSLIVQMFSNLMNRPLVEMRQAVMRIQSGDLDARVKVESNDEIGTLGETINSMATGLKEKQFMKDTFGKIVDPAVRDFLLKGNVELGGKIQSATVLFCDIRGFTSMSEKMRPDLIVELLNTYFNTMNECIISEKGILNKYIGDAIMAIFGAPVTIENHAAAAIRAALKMDAALQKLNKSFAEKGLPTIKTGTGIHTGMVLVGNIGSGARMEYTAIGDTVNIASRTEELCKELSSKLLFTEATAEKLTDEFTPVFIEQKILRGRTKPIGIYTL